MTIKRFQFIVNALIIALALGSSLGCTSYGEIENVVDSTSKNLAQRKIYIDQTSMTLTEGSFAIINVVAEEKSDKPIALNLMMMGTPGRFVPLPLTVTIPAGSLSKSVSLQTVDDNTYQKPEIFTLTVRR